MDSSSSMLVATDNDIQVIQHVLISRYFTAAAVVILVYDTLLTLNEEIRLIWPGALSFPKLLYYINRYMAIIFLIGANYLLAGFRPPMSTTDCKYWLVTAAPAQQIANLASAVILCLRVAVLYTGNRWVLRCLWTLFGIIATVSTTFTIFSIVALLKELVYNPLAAVCLPNDVSYKAYGMFVIPMVFDIVVIGLTAFKACKQVQGESGTLILYTLFRDGLVFFFIIAALRIWNSVVWLVLPPSFMYLGVYADWALLSTLTSRFFLNLRSIVYDNRHHVQSQFTGELALDSIQVTPWEFLQTNRRKP